MKTDRPINPDQLAVELGRVPLHVVGPEPDGSYVVEAPTVDEPTLQAAVDAHVADEAWTDPEAVVADALPTYEELVAEVRGIKDRAAAANVTDADAKAVADAVSGRA